MSVRQALRMHEAAANDARPLHDLFTAWVQRGNGTAQRIDCHVRSFDEALQRFDVTDARFEPLPLAP